jgi:hypothetical protein
MAAHTSLAAAPSHPSDPASAGIIHIEKALKPNDPVQTIALCKSLQVSMLMLVKTPSSVVCNSEVQRDARFVSEDVHRVMITRAIEK